MKKCKLGDLFKIQQGYAFKSEKYQKSGRYVLCTLGNISSENNFKYDLKKANYYSDDFPNNFILSEGDLIMPLTEQTFGLFGNTAFVPHTENFQFVLNQRVGKIIPNEDVDKYYLHYLLSTNSVRDQIEATATGTSQRNTSPNNIYDVVVWVPEYDKQKQIGKILYDIEKKINNNNAINNNLEQQAINLYDYWFTQYNFTDECGNPYCFSGGKMVWNEQLKRKIPENWTVKCVLDILSWQSNSQPPKSDFVYEKRDGYVRFIQNRDYDSDEYITYIPKTKSITTCNRKDILIDKYGDAGKVRYGIDGAFNVALAKLNLHDKNLQEYVRCYFETKPIYNYLHSSCMASTRASLNESNIGNLYIAIPPKSVLNMFNLFINPIRDKILLLKDENHKLISLRNFLLPMLMNGQATIDK